MIDLQSAQKLVVCKECHEPVISGFFRRCCERFFQRPGGPAPPLQEEVQTYLPGIENPQRKARENLPSQTIPENPHPTFGIHAPNAPNMRLGYGYRPESEPAFQGLFRSLLAVVGSGIEQRVCAINHALCRLQIPLGFGHPLQGDDSHFIHGVWQECGLHCGLERAMYLRY